MDRVTIHRYGSWIETPEGARVARRTLIIDPRGRIAARWPEVTSITHADDLRERLAELTMGASVTPTASR